MKKVLFNPIFIVLITFFSIILITSLNRSKQKAAISKQNLKQVEQEIAILEQKVKQNETKLYQAQTDFTKEKIIRNELLMKKEGEIVVNLPLSKVSVEKVMTEEETTAWQEWKRLLGWRKVVVKK